MKIFSKRVLIGTILTACLVPCFATTSASAEDDPLDTANARLSEALQALKAAPARGDVTKFESHRKKAVMLLTRAQGEILKAKGNDSK